jgi:hypothetical protein
MLVLGKLHSSFLTSIPPPPPPQNSCLDTIALPSFVFIMILLFSRLFFQSLKIDWLVFNMVFKISQIFVVVSPIIMIIIIFIICKLLSMLSEIYEALKSFFAAILHYYKMWVHFTSPQSLQPVNSFKIQ